MSSANSNTIESPSQGVARTWHVLSAAGEHRLEFTEALRAYSKISTVKGLAAVGLDWLLIFAAIGLWMYFPSVLMWCLAAVIVASRQHALLILMHDASHHRLVRSRNWNDKISNWLLAWPLLVTTEAYRRNHLAHHFHLNTKDDPDWVRKQGKEEWVFPKTRWGLVLLFARDVFGGGLIDQFRAIRALAHDRVKGAPVSRAAVLHRLAYYALWAALISVCGLWVPVLILWFLPAFTLLPMILRFRSIAEHFGVEGDHELNSSRNAHCAWWERLLLAPHNVGYHLDHHLFPSVPFYNLPRLHRALRAIPEYTAISHQSERLFGSSETSFLNEVMVHDARG